MPLGKPRKTSKVGFVVAGVDPQLAASLVGKSFLQSDAKSLKRSETNALKVDVMLGTEAWRVRQIKNKRGAVIVTEDQPLHLHLYPTKSGGFNLKLNFEFERF